MSILTRSTNIRQRPLGVAPRESLAIHSAQRARNDGRHGECLLSVSRLNPGKTRQGPPGLPIRHRFPHGTPVGRWRMAAAGGCEVSYFFSRCPPFGDSHCDLKPAG